MNGEFVANSETLDNICLKNLLLFGENKSINISLVGFLRSNMSWIAHVILGDRTYKSLVLNSCSIIGIS